MQIFSLSYFYSLKGAIWITEEMMMWSDGHITLDNEILSWDLLFKVNGNIKSRTYDLAVKLFNILAPSECRHNFDLNRNVLPGAAVILRTAPSCWRSYHLAKQLAKQWQS